MRLVRRLVPELGFVTVAGMAWKHRGTIRRALDLALDAPRVVREDGAKGLVEHGRRLYELDRSAPTDLRVRLSDAAAR